MQVLVCKNNCSVEYLSQLNVCTQEGCTAPLLRCKDCFSRIHFHIEQGKKKFHTYKKFDESQYYIHFLYLVKVLDIIQNKFTKTFGKINSNAEYFANHIFMTSQPILQIFQSQYALGEFFILKLLHNHQAAQFTASPSSQILTSLLKITQKSFNNIRNLLTQSTEQQQYLSYFFNQISSTNPQSLQKFIADQQKNFIDYCNQIKEKNLTFSIDKFLSLREGSDKSPYFTPLFENFLQQKYSENPQQQEIFTSSDYINYVWENLYLLCQNEKTAQYINSWIQNYQTYAEFMQGQNLVPTLLSFRMWKQHVPTDGADSKIQNKYFLDNFALAYIESLINNQYNVGSHSVKDWKQFMKYLKDYVALTKIKAEQFVDITKYSQYHTFRSKSEQFISHIQKSQQISFNSIHCIQYLNKTFKQNGQVSKKNYKKFIQTKQQEQTQKISKLKQISTYLNKQLQNQEGQKFYQVVFDDYIRSCIKQQSQPNKKFYYEFKNQVLERYDEKEIKLSNDKMLYEQKKALQAKLVSQGQKSKQGEMKQHSQKEPNVQYKIDQAEQTLAQLQEGQDQGQEQPAPDCPCCQGKPEECKKPECQMMGYCVSCSL